MIEGWLALKRNSARADDFDVYPPIFATNVGLSGPFGIALTGNDAVFRRSDCFGRCLISTKRRMQMKTKTNVKAGLVSSYQTGGSGDRS
jgi:hypothetical protein